MTRKQNNRCPSKPTPRIRRALCAAASKGVTLEAAAAYVGIDRCTLQRWLSAGKRGGECGVLCETIKKAEVRLRARCLATIKRAAEKDWRAAAWLAERGLARG